MTRGAPFQLAASERNYDFSAYPNAWMQVAWSDEIPRGKIHSLRFCGRPIVLFRGRDGVLGALDAWCPHLGAHLGQGKVCGGEIRCAFHGWRFARDGACTAIPHTTRIREAARTHAWRVRELGGLVLLWRDGRDRPPWFEIGELPELTSTDWARVGTRAYRIKTRWRELGENAVDRAHFSALHKYPGLPELTLHTDGTRFQMASSVELERFGRSFRLSLDIEAHGPGLSITRGRAGVPFAVVGSSMPIDEEELVHRMTFYVSRRLPQPLRAMLGRVVVAATTREFKRDIPIWESKICLPRPVLCDVDGPIVRYRTWARQFDEAVEP